MFDFPPFRFSGPPGDAFKHCVWGLIAASVVPLSLQSVSVSAFGRIFQGGFEVNLEQAVLALTEGRGRFACQETTDLVCAQASGHGWDGSRSFQGVARVAGGDISFG